MYRKQSGFTDYDIEMIAKRYGDIQYNQGRIDVINQIKDYKFNVYTVENALMDGNYKLSTVSSDHAIPVKALDDYLTTLTPPQA